MLMDILIWVLGFLVFILMTIGVLLIIGFFILSPFMIVYNNRLKNKKNKEVASNAIKTLESANKDYRFRNSKLFEFDPKKYILVSEQGDILLYPNQRTFSILDVNSFKLNVDGATQGGLGSAAVGGLLFGGAGAIVGAISANKGKIKKISVVFHIDDFNSPMEEFLVFQGEMQESSKYHLEIKDKLNTLFATLELVEKKIKLPSNDK